jgi:1-acyl-sn-glycerol-3-phosphate acyltransferase
MAKKSAESVKMPELRPGVERTWQMFLLGWFLRPWVALLFRIKVTGKENLPKTGGYVLAGNHVTTLDAVAVAYMMFFKLKRAPHFLAGVPIVPLGQWGTEKVMETYSSKIRPKPWHKVNMIIGKPIDMSVYKDKKLGVDELVALSDDVMVEITKLVEELRGEKAPDKRFVPSEHGLPEHGNYKKFLIIKAENDRRAAAGLEPLPAHAKVSGGKIVVKKAKGK